MATRSRQNTDVQDVSVTDEEVRQAQLILSDDSFDAASLNPALETLYAEMGMTDGADATVHVTKLDADGRGLEAQIWKGEPENYDLELIAKKFGSGQYRVKVYVKVQTGQKVLKANKVFAWLLSPEEEARRVNPTVSTPAATPAPFDPQQLGSVIADAVRAAVAVAVPQPPTVDPLSMMTQVAALMKTLQPAQPASQPQVSDPFVMMRSMIEMMNLMKGDQEPLERGTNASTGDVMLGLINKFGPLLAGAMQQNGAAMAGMQPTEQMQAQPAALQAPQPMQQQPVAQQPTQQEVDQVNMQLKMGVNFLIMQCDAGGQPATYAEVVADSVPEESLQHLLTMPDPLQWLAQIDPRVNEGARPDWFRALLAAVRELFEDDTDTPQAGATGTPQNSPVDSAQNSV